ncbi:hypothetical protein V8E55_000097 [Tylopilus felleus]
MARHVAQVNVPMDYGSLILGGLLAFRKGLSGCVSMQFIMYWQIYPGDRWTTKSLPALQVSVTDRSLRVLDLCHSAFVAVAIWDSVIGPYGNLNHADVIPWSVGCAEIFHAAEGRSNSWFQATVTFLMQSDSRCFCAVQNRKLMVAGPVFALTLIRLGAASVSMGEMLKLKCYSEFGQRFPSWVFTLGLSLSAFVDIIITASLCYFLRSNRSLIPSTNHLIDILTLWIVQNGAITCLGAIATLVCWLVMPQNRIFLGLHFVVGKLYANSLLATIRSRKYIITAGHMAPISMAQNGAFPDAHRATHIDPFALQPVNMTRTRSIEINIQRTVESKYDDADIDILSMTAESAREVEEPMPVAARVVRLAV